MGKRKLCRILSKFTKLASEHTENKNYDTKHDT